MYAIVMWGLMLGAYGFSWVVDRGRTKRAAKASVKSLLKTAPTMLAIIGIIGLVFAFVPPEWIAEYLGRGSGIWGTAAAAIIGAITLIPGIIAFPLAGAIYRQGASVATVAAFITTLTMVGVVTAPVEIKYLGRRVTLWRNGISFVAAVMIAAVMAVVIK
ncbi:MAG: permease [Firmicutes bacterium]|nr:permease [Bacillota bacterium]